MLMKAYGIGPDENPTDNFVDANETVYSGYLAAAKRLGIVSGVGNKVKRIVNIIFRPELNILPLLNLHTKFYNFLHSGDTKEKM
jgi:hypothetical protein